MTTSGPQVAGYRPRLLVVCRANQCRSPLAEHLLRGRAARLGLPIEARSAGTDAVDGKPMHPLALETLRRRGIDAQEWRSHRLTTELVDSADLILVADCKNMTGVARLRPAAARRTMALLQFADLAPHMATIAAGDAEAFGATLSTACATARSHVVPQRNYDLADPIGRNRRAFGRCADVIEKAVDEVLRPLLS